MAEEWGLIGGLALLFGFFLLLRWSTRVALNARTRFGQLAAAGLTMTIFFYVAINLMMVMGLAPVVGIPLPLFSYGGSSMLTVMTCVGMILSIESDIKTGTRRFHLPLPALFPLRRSGPSFPHPLPHLRLPFLL